MSLKELATRNIAKIAAKASKWSPEMLTIAGIGGVVGTAILASKATLKISPILEEAQDKLAAVEWATENDDRYTEQIKKTDLAKIYAKTAIDLVKLYAPAIIVGGLTISAFISSNRILRKRNVALAAAYSLLDEGFKRYRKRVIEDQGEQADRKYLYDSKVENREVDILDKDGKKTKEEMEFVDPNGISIYARFFDEGSIQFSKTSPEYNLMFLKAQQEMFNNKLKGKGFVFLNDVYESLGIPETEAGQVVGWVYGRGGDDFIDFGLYDGKSPQVRAFINGQEKAILLDFNVDGVIHTLL